MLSESLSAICSILFSNVYALYSFASSDKINKDLNVRVIYLKRKILIPIVFHHAACHSIGTALKTLNLLKFLNALACKKYTVVIPISRT